MAETVSATFRQNCYDDSKRQRMVFSADGVLISNEDISANGGANFSLACIQAQQIMFGETPMNTITLNVVNDDGRFPSSDIAGKEFSCQIGVEVSNSDYLAPSDAISAVRNKYESLSVHSVAPYIRGNVQLGDTISELENGWECKILFAYDAIYFVVYHGTDKYYAKHERIGMFNFGDADDPSDTEIAMLDRLMGYDYLSGLSYYDGGMEEYLYDSKTASHSTWNDLNATIWSGAKSKTWGYYGGFTTFKSIKYEAVPFGVWHFDKPRRANVASLSIQGKDRMSLFDEDSVDFVDSMSGVTSITYENFIRAIAAYKNVPVGDLSALNEFKTFTIDPRVYYQYKSLKDLLSYLFEVCGSNAIIDRRGRLSAMSADDTAIELPYVYSFDVADYTAHIINRMLIYHAGDYFLYQQDYSVENGVAYDFGENPMFNNSNPSGSWFSNDIHKKYGGFRNAITTSDADYSMWCDDSYSWTDENDVTYREPIFTMQVAWNGTGKVTYTNYGEEDRAMDSYDKRIENVSSINDQNLQGFNEAQRADKLYFDSNGLTVESSGLRVLNNDGQEVLKADSDGNLTLTGAVRADSGFIGNLDITNEGLFFEGKDSSGRNADLSIEPRWGNVAIELHSYTDTQVRITSNGIYFDECDAHGSVGAASGALQYYKIGNDLYLRLGWALIDVPDGDLITVVSGDILQLPSIIKSTLPTTTSAANVALINNQFYKSSSLRNLKDNIKTIENASEKVDNLRGVSFTSKCEADDPKRTFYGFIAEEVEKVTPELCTYEDGKLQGVQYDRICALLIEDNKACHKRIEELEKRLDDLERRIK